MIRGLTDRLLYTHSAVHRCLYSLNPGSSPIVYGELATQIQSVILALGDYVNVLCHACIGGTSISEDIRKLEYGQHVVSGTPNRVLIRYSSTRNIKHLFSTRQTGYPITFITLAGQVVLAGKVLLSVYVGCSVMPMLYPHVSFVSSWLLTMCASCTTSVCHVFFFFVYLHH
jgi:hypothetical protein